LHSALKKPTDPRQSNCVNARVASVVETSGSIKERRKWERLRIAIPVFVRGTDEQGQAILEFATVANIGGGGAMIVTRQYFPVGMRVTLEIPSPLLSTPLLSHCKTTFSGLLIRMAYSDRYYLLALKFARPMVSLLARQQKNLLGTREQPKDGHRSSRRPSGEMIRGAVPG
jgi:hypothetical protein